MCEQLESGERRRRHYRWMLALVAGAALAACSGDGTPATGTPATGTPELKGGGDGGGGGLTPLSRAAVPRPTGGDIVNQGAAVRLGKALFWDAQSGGDGQVACATCHFNAGADVTSGSAGVWARDFIDVNADPNDDRDDCTVRTGTARQVTGRNTPSAIGAVYFRQLFWDGRANDAFNGRNPFGATGNDTPAPTDPASTSLLVAALASQAVGPPNNSVEMSCKGRTFNGSGAHGEGSLGSKLLARAPLAHQTISPTDAALAPLTGTGRLACGPTNAQCTYYDLVAAAFGSNITSPMMQFSRIWGQAVAAYEATLIPDQTPFDQYLLGNRSALTPQQQRGLDRFTGKGGCANCHAGAELSDATVSFAQAQGLINEDGGDQGFHNIGVTPTAADLGRAASGPGGVPWSKSGSVSDRGAFKTPGLRNVGLSAPYFHNGGKATLEEVVDFYARGGDVRNPELAKRMKDAISFDAGDRLALVDFLRNGLTDCRVKRQAAPFDHPSLPKPDAAGTTLVPAVGSGGNGAVCP